MKLNLNTYTFLLSAFVIIFTGCTKEYAPIEEIDAIDVQKYINANSLNVKQYKNTGIYYQILDAGTGDTVKYSDRIFATYTAKSLDGSFSMQADSINRFTSFLGYFSGENDFPQGFSTAIKEILNKKNGKIRVIIPSHLAYGQGGSSRYNVPGNASLDCIITLHPANNITEFEDIFVKRYIQQNKITGLSRTASGLYYQIISSGAGSEVINEESTVTAAFVGKLTNGTTFDESNSYTSRVYENAPGWQEGLTELPQPLTKGSKVRLVLPPSLGYGARGSGPIPAYATLDFLVEVLDVQ